MTGHLRRQVSSLNGPAHTRLTVDGNEGDGSAAEEAKDLMEMANTKTAKAMQIHGHIAATKVGFAPLETTSQRTGSLLMGGVGGVAHPPSSRPLPHRPVSAPPSLQTMKQDVHRSPRAKGDQPSPSITSAHPLTLPLYYPTAVDVVVIVCRPRVTSRESYDRRP